MDFIAGFSLLFLVGSVLAGAGVITFSVIAPIFMSGNVAPKPVARYIKLSEKEYDFDQD